MSEPQPTSYRFDLGPGVLETLRTIKASAKQAGQLAQFASMVEEAVKRMRTDPHGWGDPLYRSKHVDAVACQGIIRPLIFRYVIYEQVKGVILMSVQCFADFA